MIHQCGVPLCGSVNESCLECIGRDDGVLAEVAQFGTHNLQQPIDWVQKLLVEGGGLVRNLRGAVVCKQHLKSWIASGRLDAQLRAPPRALGSYSHSRH